MLNIYGGIVAELSSLALTTDKVSMKSGKNLQKERQLRIKILPVDVSVPLKIHQHASFIHWTPSLKLSGVLAWRAERYTRLYKVTITEPLWQCLRTDWEQGDKVSNSLLSIYESWQQNDFYFSIKKPPAGGVSVFGDGNAAKKKEQTVSTHRYSALIPFNCSTRALGHLT